MLVESDYVGAYIGSDFTIRFPRVTAGKVAHIHSSLLHLAMRTACMPVLAHSLFACGGNC